MAGFSSGSFSSGSFSTGGVSQPPQVQTFVGGGSSWTWQDEVEDKFRKRHLKGLIAKTKRKLVELKKEEAKTERKIASESRQNHEIAGLLSKHLKLVEQIEQKKIELRDYSDEFSSMLKIVGRSLEENEEDDIETLLLS